MPTPTWAELFDCGEPFDVTPEDLHETLAEYREREREREDA